MKESPFDRKSCYDCSYCRAAVSWWCTNKDAIKARGTAIPGVIHCPFWKPEWSYIPKEYRTAENGYQPSWWERLSSKFKTTMRKLIIALLALLFMACQSAQVTCPTYSGVKPTKSLEHYQRYVRR